MQKTFELSDMGVQALNSHADGKKHKEMVTPVSVFFLRNQLKVKVLVVRAAREMQVVVLNSKHLN